MFHYRGIYAYRLDHFFRKPFEYTCSIGQLIFNCHIITCYVYAHAGQPELSLANLETFQCHGMKKIKVIAQCSAYYAKIGHHLLNDTDGSIVTSLEHKQDPEKILNEIFGKWLREDADHSWKKLIQCLRRCNLNSIASGIEDSLGMSTQFTEGIFILHYDSCLLLHGEGLFTTCQG